MANIFQYLKPNTFATIRHFNTSTIYHGQTRVMNKILSGSKKKHRYTENTPAAFSKGAFEGKQSVNSKRVSVLNKLFMRHITDLMATGENSQAFTGHGIEINRVQVTPDFKGVNVYWLAKGTESDETIEEILNSHARGLRHELSKLRVMGNVPIIKFQKDKHFTQLMEVDLRLSRADFGEDYEPTEASIKLKTQLQLNLTLDSNTKEQIAKLESESDYIDENLPPMPQNVLGLNHADILERVKKTMKKSRAMHRTKVEDEDQAPQFEHTVNNQPLIYSSNKTQREAFQEFLYKRQLMKTKANKEAKNERLEMDYMEEEWENTRKKFESNFNFDNYLDDKDYIEEETT